MATETNPIVRTISRGTVLTNRRGANLYVKAAGPKTVTLTGTAYRHAMGDRMPRALVDRWIANGRLTITDFIEFH
jgi:hypothetical protein